MDDEIRMNSQQPEEENTVKDKMAEEASAEMQEETEVPQPSEETELSATEESSEEMEGPSVPEGVTTGEEPETAGYARAGESLFAGAQEAAVDYSVAKGASVRINESGSEGTGLSTEGGSDTAAGSESPEENTQSAQAQSDKTADPAGSSEDEISFQRRGRVAGSYSSIYSDTEGGGVYNPIPDEPVKKSRKEKKSGEKDGNRSLTSRILSAVLTICLGLGSGFGGALLANRMSETAEEVADTPAAVGENASAVSISGDLESLNAASAIAQKTMPSVVGISTVSQTLTETIYGLQSGEAQGIGTGLIVSEDGYILTNSHVVNDGDAETITVDLNDGSEYEGTILWNDQALDLAIVKIEASGLTKAELRDSDTVEIGDYALAIGNPLGLDFERSVTSGIISGLNRSITVASSMTATSGNTMEGLIQTDASINSGNSGGPLINSAGQVIGINSAKASSAEGLGFAIPINTAIPIIQKIKETGTYDAAYIGITGYDLAAVASSLDNAQFSASEGVYIHMVYQGSGAAAAGLQSGDVITALNDKEIEGMSSLKTALVKYSPGDVISITYERNGESNTVDLTLGSASDSTSQEPVESPQENGGQDQQTPEQAPEEQGEGRNDPYGGLGDLFNGFFGN